MTLEHTLTQRLGKPTMTSLKTRLTVLWAFVTFNYLYCDLIGVMDPEMPAVIR